jgi:two-component system catabolic regulation response regulator CreB
MTATRRVLIVEDEPAIADTLVYALKTEGFEPEWCATGRAGLAALAAKPFALVVLDVGLPDDYLVKPFSPRELTARVKAILRRTNGGGQEPAAGAAPPAQEAEKSAAEFVIDEERCTIVFRGTTLDLTRYEFRLLKVLVAKPGRVFSRDQLMSAAWEDPGASLDRTVDAHIKTLRSKLRTIAPEADPIQTHRGLGYSLKTAS